MANKKFTPHAIKVLKKNPNVRSVSPSKISFTDEFQQKIADAIRAGENPYPLFAEAGFSERVLGKSRIVGTVSMIRSRYELEDAPKMKGGRKASNKPAPETAAQRRKNRLGEAVLFCDGLIADPVGKLNLPADTDKDTIRFAAIRKTYETKKHVVVKDLCAYYGYGYPQYYTYLKSVNPSEEKFDNPLNSHRKK